MPTTLVVQLVDPMVSVPEDWLAGATWATSGAATLDPRASASALVSVDAEPNPPRMPPLVALPGETISRLVPRALIWSRTWA